MPLVPMGELLRRAQHGGYCVGAFDCWNLESARAIMEAAKESSSPVILLTGPAGLGADEDGIRYFAGIVKAGAGLTGVPVALLLNEATDFHLVVQAIRHGFTGVMMETSDLPLAENIAQTKRVVELAHTMGVSVEAPLGHIPLPEQVRSAEAAECYRTDVKEAVQFVAETGVDALAVIFGNVHVAQPGSAEIDLEHVSRLREAISVPLVAHGGTGFPELAVPLAVQRGICKFNLGAILRKRFVEGMREILAEPAQSGSWASYQYVEKVLAGGQQAVRNEALRRMQLLGSTGKAKACAAAGELVNG